MPASSLAARVTVLAAQMGAVRAFSSQVPLTARILGRHSSSHAVKMSAYDFNARDLDTDQDVSLSKYKGKVSLIVNVASK